MVSKAWSVGYDPSTGSLGKTARQRPPGVVDGVASPRLDRDEAHVVVEIGVTAEGFDLREELVAYFGTRKAA